MRASSYSERVVLHAFVGGGGALLLAACCGGCPAGGSFAVLPSFQFNVPGAPGAAAVTGVPAFSTEPIFASIPGHSGSHAPTIAAFSDGELLAAWYSYVGPNELDGAAIYAARRSAGATGWSDPTLLVELDQDVGNPVLYSAGDSVWLFYAVVPGGWSTARTEFQRSIDRGQTWSTAQPIDGPLGTNVRYPPIALDGGELLLPAYDDLLQRSLFFASPDGLAWTLRAVLATDPPHQCIQPSVARLASGRLLAVMRNVGQGWLWVSASDDEGHSWTRPQDSGFPNPASATALLRTAGGNLVLVYNDSATDRHPLSAAISGDDGVTWWPPRVLVDGPDSYAYPALTQTPDGLLHVVYSHNRERIQHVTLSEAWLATSSE